MKTISRFSILFIIFSMINISSCAQNYISDDEKQTDKIQTGDSSFPFHPRLLLLKDEENIIKGNIGTDNTWKGVHNTIINACNDIISKPPVQRILIGRRLLDKSREALRRIFYLSYAWRMTGEKKYLDRAEQEMIAVSAFTDWNPSHFLDVAEMTMAVSIGYDWLYSSLSESSRIAVRTAIIEKGLKPSLDTKYNSWVKASHNWNQVCNAGMTYGALAVFEDDSLLAKKIISRACESIRLPMGDYQPDGAYPEGYGYWGYGTTFNVMFISAYEKAFKKKFEVPENEGLLKSAGYLENMIGTTRYNFNYSDGGSGAGLNPAMFWLANRNDDPTVLWMEKYFVKDLKSASDRLLPAIMIWNGGMSIDKITAPSKNIWVGQGKNPVALMRSSWDDPNSIYIGFKGGSPKVNHGHMDAGSFVMDALGVRWAMDFGSQDYNSLEQAGVNLWNMAQTSQRWEIFRYNNFVHNTLTINGQLQKVDGFAQITGYSDNSGILHAVMNLTRIYDGQLKSSNRGIAIVEGKYVSVRDEIETLANPTVVRWTLLTSANVVITGTNSAELTKSGKKLIIKVGEPAAVTMKTWSTVPPHDYDAPNPGTTLVGFEVTIPADTKTALQVFLLPGGVTPNPATQPAALGTWNK